MSTETIEAPAEVVVGAPELCNATFWHRGEDLPPATQVIECVCGENRVPLCGACVAKWRRITDRRGNPECLECGQLGPYLIGPL